MVPAGRPTGVPLVMGGDGGGGGCPCECNQL